YLAYPNGSDPQRVLRPVRVIQTVGADRRDEGRVLVERLGVPRQDDAESLGQQIARHRLADTGNAGPVLHEGSHRGGCPEQPPDEFIEVRLRRNDRGGTHDLGGRHLDLGAAGGAEDGGGAGRVIGLGEVVLRDGWRRLQERAQDRRPPERRVLGLRVEERSEERRVGGAGGWW